MIAPGLSSISRLLPHLAACRLLPAVRRRLSVPGILLSFLTPLLLAAQPRLELLHADYSRGSTVNGREVARILEGNVHVRQDTVEIFCDRATYFRERREILLEGKVRVRRGKELLTARKVTYYEDRKMAVAERNVQVERPGQRLQAEHLEYFYETDQAYARRNVVVTDLERGARSSGDRGEYVPQENRSMIEGNAYFRQADSVSGDTLHIYAQRLEYFLKPQRRAIARKSVKIVRGDLVAYCDSAIYLPEEERAFLSINPRALQKQQEITGDKMELRFQKMKLYRILVTGHALARSVEDSAANKVNRLSGQKIIGFMAAQQLDQLWALDNARSFYYLKDERGEQGINSASADTIRIYFVKGAVDHIAVRGGSQGIYYPSDYQGKIDKE